MAGYEIGDLLELCAPEYNMPELSDRVLVFDIMQDGWETASILNSNISEALPNESTASDGKRNQAIQSKASQSDLCQSETTQKFEDLIADDVSTDRDESPLLTIVKDFSRLKLCQSEATQKFEDLKAEDVSTDTDESPLLTVVNDFNGLLRQHKIYVHSFWLSVQSPFFRSLFYSSGMKESYEKEVHLKISESEKDAYLILIEAMYHGDVLDDKTVDDLLAVIELADKYELKLVFKKCKHILKDRFKTHPFETSIKTFHVIKVKHDMANVKDLLAILKPIVVQEFCPLDENWESDKFTSLEELCLKHVLSSHELIVQSENTVFHALMYWMRKNKIDPDDLEETNNLLAVVRFELVTADYLYNVIRNHPIATRMPYFSVLYYGGLTYHALPSDQKKLFKKKPVSRRQPEKTIIQYTYVVNKEDYKCALAYEVDLNSRKFWACGYRISVGTSPSNKNFHLIVHDLNEESYVPLRFAIFKKTGYSGYLGWRQKAFEMKSCEEIFKCSSLCASMENIFKNEINCTLNVAVTPWEKDR